jgi:hypothetical protein
MAKRLNPRRRLIAQLREWESQERSLRIAYNDEPLQKGNVRASMFNPTRARAWIATIAPSHSAPKLLWETGGKTGKLVKGNLVRPKGKPQFQGVGVNQPIDASNLVNKSDPARAKIGKSAGEARIKSAQVEKVHQFSRSLARANVSATRKKED